MALTIKNYNPINFSQVSLWLSPSDPSVLDLRMKYIKNQLDTTQKESFSSQINTFSAYVSSDEFKEISHTDEQRNELLIRTALIKQTKALLVLVQQACDVAVKNKNKQLLFEIEQVLGRAQLIFNRPSRPDESDNSEMIDSYNQKVNPYNDNLIEIGKLAQVLVRHEIAWMRYLGIALMAVGVAAIITFILLASVPPFANAFALALASTKLLSLFTTIGTAFGVSISAAGPAGASIVGGTVGASFFIGGLATFFNGRKRSDGLSEAADELSKTKKLEPIIGSSNYHRDNEDNNRPRNNNNRPPSSGPAPAGSSLLGVDSNPESRSGIFVAYNRNAFHPKVGVTHRQKVEHNQEQELELIYA